MNFEYCSDPCQSESKNDLIVEIPLIINSKADLLEVFRTSLNFPDYFGKNWDALNDMLRDLSWLGVDSVIVTHSEIPDLPEPDLRKYLSILHDVVDSWKKADGIVFKVVFPERDQSRIERLL